jgi:hypothetical protein
MQTQAMRKLIPLLLLSTAALAATGDDDWWREQPQERALAVNEGELVFLEQPPAKAVHHHANRVRITRATLQNGWAHLEQCHENLDPVAELQIVFNPERVRKLVIRRTRNVGDAFLEGASIQLRDIRRNALICLSAETHSVRSLGAGLYELRSGPFMRRFLDGYYPMHLTFEVDYPDDIALFDAAPGGQPGLKVVQEPQRILLDAWFEGRLTTRFRFSDNL